MPSRHKIDLGKRGEEIAKKFLEDKGYQTIESNYRYGHGEIDLICKEGETLVFVEVKTRNTLEFGYPEEAVTHSKMRQIRKIAIGYLTEKEIEDVECRIDVVAILEIKGQKEINHIKNAFTFLD